jgi:hypothetical protein
MKDVRVFTYPGDCVLFKLLESDTIAGSNRRGELVDFSLEPSNESQRKEWQAGLFESPVGIMLLSASDAFVNKWFPHARA